MSKLKIVIFFLGFFSISECLSQTSTLCDSLIAYEDEVFTLKENNDEEAAYEAAIRGKNLAISCRDIIILSFANLVGEYLVGKGQVERAITNYNEAIFFVQQHSIQKKDDYDSSLEGYTFLAQGQALDMKGSWNEALESYKKAEGVFRNHGGLWQVFINEGLILTNLNRIDEALSYYDSALHYLNREEEELSDRERTIQVAIVQNNKGYAHHRRIDDDEENLDNAKKFYNDGYRLRESVKDSLGLITSLVNLASVVIYQNDLEGGRQYLRDAERINEIKKNSRSTISILLQKGIIDEVSANTESALSKYLEAFRLADENDFFLKKLEACQAIIDLYIPEPDSLDMNYDSLSIAYLRKLDELKETSRMTEQKTNDIILAWTRNKPSSISNQTGKKDSSMRETLPVITFFAGLGFLVVLLIIALVKPNIAGFGQVILRVILSLAAASFGMGLTGFILLNISVEVSEGNFMMISAGGALALFVMVYRKNPAMVKNPTTSEADSPDPEEETP